MVHNREMAIAKGKDFAEFARCTGKNKGERTRDPDGEEE